jgi:hypothetical protein
MQRPLLCSFRESSLGSAPFLGFGSVVDAEFKNRATLGAAEERKTFKEGHGSMQQGFKGTLDQLGAYLASVRKESNA